MTDEPPVVARVVSEPEALGLFVKSMAELCEQTHRRLLWIHVHNALCCACMALVWALSTPQSAVTFGLIFLSVGSLPVLGSAFISWLRRRR